MVSLYTGNGHNSYPIHKHLRKRIKTQVAVGYVFTCGGRRKATRFWRGGKSYLSIMVVWFKKRPGAKKLKRDASVKHSPATSISLIVARSCHFPLGLHSHLTSRPAVRENCQRCLRDRHWLHPPGMSNESMFRGVSVCKK
jgi:hypothetical protein